jgi:hypothetical protein
VYPSSFFSLGGVKETFNTACSQCIVHPYNLLDIIKHLADRFWVTVLPSFLMNQVLPVFMANRGVSGQHSVSCAHLDFDHFFRCICSRQVTILVQGTANNRYPLKFFQSILVPCILRRCLPYPSCSVKFRVASYAQWSIGLSW